MFRSRHALKVFTAKALDKHIHKSAKMIKQAEIVSWIGVGGILWGLSDAIHPITFLLGGSFLCFQNGYTVATLEWFLSKEARRYTTKAEIKELEEGKMELTINSLGLERKLTLVEEENGVRLKDCLSVDRDIVFDNQDGEWDDNTLFNKAQDLVIKEEAVEYSPIFKGFELYDGTQGKIISLTPEEISKRKDQISEFEQKVKQRMPENFDMERHLHPTNRINHLGNSSLMFAGLICFCGLLSIGRSSKKKVG